MYKNKQNKKVKKIKKKQCLILGSTIFIHFELYPVIISKKFNYWAVYRRSHSSSLLVSSRKFEFMIFTSFGLFFLKFIATTSFYGASFGKKFELNWRS